MPWSPAQHRLFEAAAHKPQIAHQHGMAQANAKQMAGEGVKKQASTKGQLLAQALQRSKPSV